LRKSAELAFIFKERVYLAIYSILISILSALFYSPLEQSVTGAEGIDAITFN